MFMKNSKSVGKCVPGTCNAHSLCLISLLIFIGMTSNANAFHSVFDSSSAPPAIQKKRFPDPKHIRQSRSTCELAFAAELRNNPGSRRRMYERCEMCTKSTDCKFVTLSNPEARPGTRTEKCQRRPEQPKSGLRRALRLGHKNPYGSMNPRAPAAHIKVEDCNELREQQKQLALKNTVFLYATSRDDPDNVAAGGHPGGHYDQFVKDSTRSNDIVVVATNKDGSTYEGVYRFDTTEKCFVNTHSSESKETSSYSSEEFPQMFATARALKEEQHARALKEEQQLGVDRAEHQTTSSASEERDQYQETTTSVSTEEADKLTKTINQVPVVLTEIYAIPPMDARETTQREGLGEVETLLSRRDILSLPLSESGLIMSAVTDFQIEVQKTPNVEEIGFNVMLKSTHHFFDKTGGPNVVNATVHVINPKKIVYYPAPSSLLYVAMKTDGLEEPKPFAYVVFDLNVEIEVIEGTEWDDAKSRILMDKKFFHEPVAGWRTYSKGTYSKEDDKYKWIKKSDSEEKTEEKTDNEDESKNIFNPDELFAQIQEQIKVTTHRKIKVVPIQNGEELKAIVDSFQHH